MTWCTAGGPREPCCSRGPRVRHGCGAECVRASRAGVEACGMAGARRGGGPEARPVLRHAGRGLAGQDARLWGGAGGWPWARAMRNSSPPVLLLLLLLLCPWARARSGAKQDAAQDQGAKHAARRLRRWLGHAQARSGGLAVRAGGGPAARRREWTLARPRARAVSQAAYRPRGARTLPRKKQRHAIAPRHRATPLRHARSIASAGRMRPTRVTRSLLPAATTARIAASHRLETSPACPLRPLAHSSTRLPTPPACPLRPAQGLVRP